MPDEFAVIAPPRARILAAARDLFHRHGLRGVGVDAIAEAAGTNKMTLYRHFESKDELIVAYLRGVVTVSATTWALAPGYTALMTTCGGVISGNCETGSRK